MFVLYVVVGIIILGLLGALVSFMEDYYRGKYEYGIYKVQVLTVLFFAFVLGFVVWMGLDGSISYDNTIAAAVVGKCLWVGALFYNIAKTSFIAGVILTLFQSILAMLLVFLLVLFICGNDSKKKSRH